MRRGDPAHEVADPKRGSGVDDPLRDKIKIGMLGFDALVQRHESEVVEHRSKMQRPFVEQMIAGPQPGVARLHKKPGDAYAISTPDLLKHGTFVFERWFQPDSQSGVKAIMKHADCNEPFE